MLFLDKYSLTTKIQLNYIAELTTYIIEVLVSLLLLSVVAEVTILYIFSSFCYKLSYFHPNILVMFLLHCRELENSRRSCFWTERVRYMTFLTFFDDISKNHSFSFFK